MQFERFIDLELGFYSPGELFREIKAPVLALFEWRHSQVTVRIYGIGQMQSGARREERILEVFKKALKTYPYEPTCSLVRSKGETFQDSPMVGVQ